MDHISRCAVKVIDAFLLATTNGREVPSRKYRGVLKDRMHSLCSIAADLVYQDLRVLLLHSCLPSK